MHQQAAGLGGAVVDPGVAEEVAVDGGGQTDRGGGRRPALDLVHPHRKIVGVVGAQWRRVEPDVRVADRPGHLVDALRAEHAGVEHDHLVLGEGHARLQRLDRGRRAETGPDRAAGEGCRSARQRHHDNGEDGSKGARATHTEHVVQMGRRWDARTGDRRAPGRGIWQEVRLGDRGATRPGATRAACSARASRGAADRSCAASRAASREPPRPAPGRASRGP